MDKHCWHDIGPNTGLDADQICCKCGIVYHAQFRVPVEGHGPYCPEKRRVNRPEGPCVTKKFDAANSKIQDGAK